MRRLLVFFLLMAGAACGQVVVQQAPVPQAQTAPAVNRSGNGFAAVVARVEPVAESMCRARRPGLNCDFRIVVDRRQQGVNAYQTLDQTGRPITGFTPGLIAEARNDDELAFVLAHEAAHHILGHIPRQQQNAQVGGLLTGALAGALGVNDAASIETAQRIGATVGARRYSKDFELEADALGTRITAAAGFDPLVGAGFFTRIPDPGDRFLGTHPPNADRILTVQRVAAGL